MLQDALNEIQRVARLLEPGQQRALLRSMGFLYLMLAHRLINLTGGFVPGENVEIGVGAESSGESVLRVPLGTRVREVERVLITETYRQTKGVAKTASLLGLSERTLWRKLKEYRLVDETFPSKLGKGGRRPGAGDSAPGEPPEEGR